MKPLPDTRASHLHTARVLLHEARIRRATQPRFADVLLQWAANARRRAAECRPAQGELFETRGK